MLIIQLLRWIATQKPLTAPSAGNLYILLPHAVICPLLQLGPHAGLNRMYDKFDEAQALFGN